MVWCLVIDGDAGSVDDALAGSGRCVGAWVRVLVSRSAESVIGLASLASALLVAWCLELDVLPLPQRLASCRAAPAPRSASGAACVFTAFVAVLIACARVAVLIAVDVCCGSTGCSQSALLFVSRRFGDAALIGLWLRCGSARARWRGFGRAVPLRLGALSVAALHRLSCQAVVSLLRSIVLRVHRRQAGLVLRAPDRAASRRRRSLVRERSLARSRVLAVMVRWRFGVLPASVRSALLVAAASSARVSGLSPLVFAAERAAIVTTGIGACGSRLAVARRLRWRGSRCAPPRSAALAATVLDIDVVRVTARSLPTCSRCCRVAARRCGCDGARSRRSRPRGRLVERASSLTRRSTDTLGGGSLRRRFSLPLVCLRARSLLLHLVDALSSDLPCRARSCCSLRPLSPSARSTTRFAISGCV